MNKVTVNKQQNAESQDKGTGLGQGPSPRRGEGMSLGPAPALHPPSQAPQTGLVGIFLEVTFWWMVFWVDVFWDVSSGHLLPS